MRRTIWSVCVRNASRSDPSYARWVSCPEKTSIGGAERAFSCEAWETFGAWLVPDRIHISRLEAVHGCSAFIDTNGNTNRHLSEGSIGRSRYYRNHMSRRRRQKSLEIWRQVLVSACLPCLAGAWPSPSVSPKYTFSWRQRWRQASERTVFARSLCKLSRRLGRCAQRSPRAAAFSAHDKRSGFRSHARFFCTRRIHPISYNGCLVDAGKRLRWKEWQTL